MIQTIIDSIKAYFDMEIANEFIANKNKIILKLANGTFVSIAPKKIN